MILEFEAQSDSLGKDAKYVAASSKRVDKFSHFRKLDHARKALFDADVKNKKGEGIHRTRLCHAARSYNAESISLKISHDASKKNANLSGVQTCGSVWSCPVCSRRIATQRGREVGQAIDHMTEKGHLPIMLTFTARHGLEFKLKVFKTLFMKAHRYFVQHYRWRQLKDALGAKHSIKAIEGTWGYENGWHYHHHSVLFIHVDALATMDDSDFQEWVEIARDLWLHCLERAGLDGIGERAFNVQADHEVKANYLSKLGLQDETSKLDYELSAGHNKKHGMNVWQILDKSLEGDKRFTELYVEWVEAMSGAQWIVWSDGLKELCGIAEIDDEAAAADEANDEEIMMPLMDISDEEFTPVRKMHAVADLLIFAAVARNEQSVREWLKRLADEWRLKGEAGELERLKEQFKALDEKLANMRKGYNKRGVHPPADSDFWRMAEQHKQLKKRLETR